MSMHVVPEAERWRHETSEACPCRPVQQSQLLDGGGTRWVVWHHELAEPMPSAREGGG